jgi:hypothetical protein
MEGMISPAGTMFESPCPYRMLREGHTNAVRRFCFKTGADNNARFHCIYHTCACCTVQAEPAKGTEIFLFIFFVDSVLSVVNYPVAHSIRHFILRPAPPQ